MKIETRGRSGVVVGALCLALGGGCAPVGDGPPTGELSQALSAHSARVLASKRANPTFSVCWTNATDENLPRRLAVERYQRTSWERVSRVRFTGWQACQEGVFTEIRVRLLDAGGTTTWGDISAGTPIQLATDASRVNSVHEFGHALGFAHEHDRGDRPRDIDWARAAGAQGDSNAVGPFDAESVMCYFLARFTPAGQFERFFLYDDGVTQIRNTNQNAGVLSRLDAANARHYYGANPAARGDVFWRDASANQIGVWTMRDTANVESIGPAIGGEPASTIVGFGNFDGDRYPDVLWRSSLHGALRVWSFDGTSVRARAPLTAAAPADWDIAGVADFDGDGTTDVLALHPMTRDLDVWFVENNAVTRTLNVARAVPTDLAVAGAADLDGDRRADVLWRDTRTGAVVVWRMNGATVLGRDTVNDTTPLDWRIDGTGDFDGDGTSDILWRHRSEGHVGVWLMAESAVIPSRRVAAVREFHTTAYGIPGEWVIRGTGDLDADGRDDILWHNIQTGDAGAWAMDGGRARTMDTFWLGIPTQWRITGALSRPAP